MPPAARCWSGIGEPADTVYSHCCGGVICSAEDMWDGPNEQYEKTVLDRLADVSAPDLSSFASARQWTAVAVDSLCNPDQEGYPEYAKKYYKWQKRYSGSEFSAMVNRGYGTGDVLDVLVTRRTTSGRVREFKIVGERKTVTVKREMETALGAGRPLLQLLHLRQGARREGQAQPDHHRRCGVRPRGGNVPDGGVHDGQKRLQNYRQILAHYYKDVKIRRLYK